MRISLGYPSLDDPRGFPQISQNRQAQFFHKKAAIYPYIPAMAATLLSHAGHEVLWLDGPAEGLTWKQQLDQLLLFNPDLVAWEVKTPSVIGAWKRIDELKSALPKTTVVLMGDHVTALPQESIDRSKVDVVVRGGDYDFALKKITDILTGVINVFVPGSSSLPKYSPYLLTDWIECEIYKLGLIWNQPTNTDLKQLPLVDRKLTKWWLYGYGDGSGNYRYLPGTHSMVAGRDCWFRHNPRELGLEKGGCTFCSWTNIFKNWRCGTVDQFMAEIENCASLGIREVFDDTGTFPIGDWLFNVCQKVADFNGGNKHFQKPKVVVGCNMRPGALSQEQYQCMSHAGFRFILYGLESANQSTLDRINKGQKPGDLENSVRWATEAGLEPHVTVMLGYPWETKEDALRTVEFTKKLFRKGWISTLQYTIVIPYPGTELYKQCLTNGWLKYEPGSWMAWDMRKPVMKCPIPDRELLAMTRSGYRSFITPRYIMKKVVSIRTKDDWKYLWRGMKYLLGHLADFSGSTNIH